MEEHVALLIVDGRERGEIDDEVFSRLRNSVRTRVGLQRGDSAAGNWDHGYSRLGMRLGEIPRMSG